MHKSLFKEHGLFDEKLKVCEDYEMWLRISSCEEIFFLQDKLVVKHGGHCDQLSKKYWGMDRFRVEAIEKNINRNYFSKKQNLIAINYLLKKIEIIMTGAKKRENVKTFTNTNKNLIIGKKLKMSINIYKCLFLQQFVASFFKRRIRAFHRLLSYEIEERI